MVVHLLPRPILVRSPSRIITEDALGEQLLQPLTQGSPLVFYLIHHIFIVTQCIYLNCLPLSALLDGLNPGVWTEHVFCLRASLTYYNFEAEMEETNLSAQPS